MIDDADPALSATELTVRTVDLIASNGAGQSALEAVGPLLARFARHAPGLGRGQTERVLRVEADGTFELVQKLITGVSPFVATYDTWVVLAPRTGELDVEGDGMPRRLLKPGASIGFEVGRLLMLTPLGASAQVCFLFGIARQHLPPPRRSHMLSSAAE